MEYERIDKVQTGVISPSKLRLKLLAGNLGRRSGGGNNSSRTSPSKIVDTEFAKNGLLEAADAFLGEGKLKEPDGASATCFNMPNSVRKLVSSGQDEHGAKKHPKDYNHKGREDANHLNHQDNCKDSAYQVQVGNGSAVHPARPVEEYGSDYDCKHDNASASTFEFHRGERVLPNPVLGPFSRPLPSKWDDAEKWIISRQKSLPGASKNRDAISQLNRPKATNWVRVAPEAVVPEAHLAQASVFQAIDGKRPYLFHMPSQNAVEKFPCAAVRSLPFSRGPNGAGVVMDLASGGYNSIGLNEQKEAHEVEVSEPETGIPPVKSVCMRDMGTEMTPTTSLEPSRMETPLGATTPIRSFNSSRDSTPRRGSPTTTPVKSNMVDQSGLPDKGLSEEEFRLKTRREIVALGMKLGKMNIAAWASRDDLDNACSSQKLADSDALDKAEFEARAAAWEEAEKSKYMASFRRAEVSIQAWESQQKVKYEAGLREMEVQLERKRAAAQEKMMRKLASTKKQCERKLAAAEARKTRQAARTAKQVERIRRTGNRSSHNLFCCSMFF